MASPEELSIPMETAERTVTSRRNVLKALGLLPIALATGAEARVERFEVASIEPHVDIEKKEVTEPLDLVTEGVWNMEGAALQNGALVLTPIDREIINKRAGNERVPNPPFNLYGTHLQAEGQFSLAAQVSHGPNAAISLRVCAGEPPLRFDDFRFLRTPEVECRIDSQTLVVNVRSADQSAPQELGRFALPQANSRNVEMQRTGSMLAFIVDGQPVGSIPASYLDGERIWLGAGSEEGEAQVTDWVAKPLGNDRLDIVNTNTIEITQPTPEGLQTLVTKKRLVIGTGASLSHMLADDRYAQLLLGTEFGRVTPENGMKPQDVQTIEGVWSFEEADAMVDIAQRHGLEVHGHTLMYDKAMPKWMAELPYQTNADKQRLRQVLDTHVRTVVSHFKGKVQSWDVWNELLSGFNNEVTLSQNPFTRGLGEEALDIAFRAARAADPTAKLFINDYGLETNPQGRGLFMLGLVTRAKLRGVPIDGIGIQGHVYEMPRDTINPLLLKTFMAAMVPLGVQARVTEIDVTGQNGSEAQAKQFADVAKVCLAMPNCTGFTVWGPGDKYGSTASVEAGQLKPGNALLYDAQFNAKAARQAVANVLKA